MNILIVATEIAPPFGGIQTWNNHLVQGLSKSHDIAVAAPAKCDLSTLIDIGASRIFPISAELPIALGEIHPFAKDIFYAIREHKPDVVHLSHAGLAFLLPMLANAEVPSVITVHGNDLTRPWLWLHHDPKMRASALRKALQNASCVTAVSHHSARLAEVAGAISDVIVVPNSVDMNYFFPGNREQARRSLGLTLGCPILLSVGRLQERKGFLDVIAAIPKLSWWNPIYLIVGSEPGGSQLQANIISKAESLGISNQLQVYNSVAQEDLVYFYQAANLFVLPCYNRHDKQGFDSEGFGIVYLEAAACELAVVAADSGGVKDAIRNGETGVLVPPRDVSAIADVIDYLFSYPAVCHAMGTRGKQYVESNFTISSLAQRMTSVYEQAVLKKIKFSQEFKFPKPSISESLQAGHYIDKSLLPMSQSPSQSFSSNPIQRLCDERGISFSNLAKKLFVSETFLRDVNAGIRPLSHEFALKAQGAAACIQNVSTIDGNNSDDSKPIIEGALSYNYCQDMGIITSYFNPARYASKLRNYISFISPIEHSGLPYITIECVFDDAPFELSSFKNVVKVRAKDVMWQKERLLNIALQSLPSQCTKVVWIDCDILFRNPGWATEASTMLDIYPVIQPFNKVIRLPRGHNSYVGTGTKWEGFSSKYMKNPNALVLGKFHSHGHTGFAWAARREILEMHGFYDACIVGGGDHLMAHGFCGDWDSTCFKLILRHNEAHIDHAVDWCKRVYQDVRARVGYIPGEILHLWHGNIDNRQYSDRSVKLANFAFNPAIDLKIGCNGAWEWSSEKPGLHQWLIQYFQQRQEDESSQS